MKIIYSLILLFCFPLGLLAQKLPEDWDNYYISTKNKPVSIVVNLGLHNIAPLKLKPNVIIVRVKIQEPNEDGLPNKDESVILEHLESDLEVQLGKDLGAVYAGRFTQRGIKEHYYYTGDTTNYQDLLHQIMSQYAEYSWLAKVENDVKWTNYFEVLYPSVYDLDKIENRRMIDFLKKKGDKLDQAREIEHSFRFKTETSRKEFLQSLSLEGFKIISMPKVKTDDEAYPFTLEMSRSDIPQQIKMDQLTQVLLKEVMKVNGKYDGWQTQVVKD